MPWRWRNRQRPSLVCAASEAQASEVASEPGQTSGTHRGANSGYGRHGGLWSGALAQRANTRLSATQQALCCGSGALRATRSERRRRHARQPSAPAVIVSSTNSPAINVAPRRLPSG